MTQSLYLDYVKKFFSGIVLGVTAKLNDTKNPLTYRHRTMLRPDFSLTGNWESLSTYNTLVMADVVAMDSSLPLKKRDTITRSTGKIAKMGMKMQLDEKQQTELDVLIATNGDESQLLAKLFADTPKCIGGIYERNERIFLEGLSSGVALVDDTENVGVGIRLDYGYPDDNKFGVAAAWTGTDFKPFDDIDIVLAKVNADGNSIVKVMTDKSTINKISATTQAKELIAFKAGFVGSNIPMPSLEQINNYMSDKYGFVFETVDRSVRYEKNGVQTPMKPWKAGSMIFLSTENVGSLVWANLAEANRPVPGVTYQKVDNYILVSKYSVNDPFGEFTTSQARVVPVINGVESIYMLDTTTIQA